MKTVNLKRLIGLILLTLMACQSSENERLARKLDSVSTELEVTRGVLMDSQQVKALLDSIDASRRVTNTLGTDAQNNLTRLNDINEYIKDINIKIDQMEKSIKYVNTMAASILTLQADIEARTQKIAKLEADVKKISTKDKTIMLTVQRKDSTLAEFIKSCQADLAVLQKAMEDVHAKNSKATADLYFKQAEALTAISQNVSSSSKKKTVKHEALELYKISLSLGKREAQERINALKIEL
jgi:chromosome segregation ATPase